MFHWIIHILLVVWVFTAEARIQALKEDSDDHNAEIARHGGRIETLEKGK